MVSDPLRKSAAHSSGLRLAVQEQYLQENSFSNLFFAQIFTEIGQPRDSFVYYVLPRRSPLLTWFELTSRRKRRRRLHQGSRRCLQQILPLDNLDPCRDRTRHQKRKEKQRKEVRKILVMFSCLPPKVKNKLQGELFYLLD